jgi:signal peptidase II
MNVPQRSGLVWLVVSLGVVALDQVSKTWIMTNFELHESVTLLPMLDIIYARNTGAAFSLLADAGGWQRWFFTVLAVGVSVGIVMWLRRLDGRAQALMAAGLALILGGALGNVIDRVLFGYVVDFIAVHWDNHYFPAFNVADSCISVGAALLILDSVLTSRKAKD